MREVRELAQRHTEAVVRTLVSIMNDVGRERVAAADAILDRGSGRPQQSVDVQAKVQPSDPIILVHTAPPPKGWLATEPA